MFNNYLEVLTPVIALLANVLSQVVFFRLFCRAGLLVSIFLGFIAGCLLIVLFDLIYDKSAWVFLIHLLTYGCLGYCYFHFINLGETGRRIRILRELKDAPDGLTLKEFLARYNAKEIIERRLSRLVATGQIVIRDGRFYIGKPVVLAMARILVGFKLLVLGKGSEFD